MLPIAAAIVFAVGLICDWADVSSDFFSWPTFTLLGWLLLSIHFALPYVEARRQRRSGPLA